MSPLTLTVLTGAVVGLGVFLLVRALVPGRKGAVASVREVDRLRAQSGASAQYGGLPGAAPAGGEPSGLRGRVGARVAAFYLRQGWELRSLRSDLALLERGWETFLATKVLLGVAGLVFGPFLFGIAWLIGLGSSPVIPIWLALACAAVFFMLPDLEVRRDAAAKRRDLRRVVGAYLDLVAMNLAGGRGLPEALMAAAEVGGGWALRRIRDALADARITGQSQWQALGQLGAQLGVEELKDLSVSLGLVADDGAKVRASLASRAETMRHRELAEIEGSAGEKSQSMLVAQLMLCAGFLVFLIFPAAMRVFQI